MALAIRSGIAPAAWLAEEDPRVIPTALDLLAEENAPVRHHGGPLMSG